MAAAKVMMMGHWDSNHDDNDEADWRTVGVQACAVLCAWSGNRYWRVGSFVQTLDLAMMMMIIIIIMKTTMMKMMALDKSDKVLAKPQYCVPHCWE